MNKFFTFFQNNSGGSFVVDENVDRYVIIEAINGEEANRIAEDKGLYFNGCQQDEEGNDIGRDCGCCGPRWYPQLSNEGDAVPSINGVPITPEQKLTTRIHYKEFDNS